MLVICLSSICLAAVDPTDVECSNNRCKVLAELDMCWTILFALEMVLKMGAMGVWGPGAYTSEPWNNFDAVIVMVGLLDFVPDTNTGGIKALRVLRVLRPLRAINRFPELKLLISLMLDLLPMLGSVLAICGITFLIFAILGLHLWEGILHNRCYNGNGTELDALGYGEEPYVPYVCNRSPNAGIQSCPSSYNCINQGVNPYFGAVHFDDIYGSLVVVFMIVTLDQWIEASVR